MFVSKRVRSSFIVAVFVAVALLPTSAQAITRGTVASGAWSNPAIWNPAGVPTAADDVTISDGHTVNVDIALAEAASINILSDSGATLLTIDGTNQLTVSGDVNIGSAGAFDADLQVGQGSLACSNIDLRAGSVVFSTLQIGTGTVKVNSIGSTANVARSVIEFVDAGVLAIAGDMNAIGTLTNSTLGAGSTVKFDGTAAQTIASNGFQNLVIANTGNPLSVHVSAPAYIGVGGNLQIASGSLLIGDTLAVGGSSALAMGPNSWLRFGDDTDTAAGVNMPFFPGGFTLDSSSTIEYGAAFTQTITGNVPYQNLRIRHAGPAIVTKSPSGNITVQGSISIAQQQTGPLTFATGAHTVTVFGSITGSTGEVRVNSGGTLSFPAGAFLHTGAFAAETSSTVSYGGSGQTVRAVTYYDLVITGTNVLLGGATTAQNVTIASSAFLTPNTNTLLINGNLTVDGTISGISGTIQLASSGGTISGSGAIYPAVISDSRQINGSLLFGGNFSLISGTSTIINTGATDIDLNLDGPSGSQWVNAPGSSLTIGGHVLNSGITIDASANANAVTFDGASQNVFGSHSFWDLLFAGSGLKGTAVSTDVANDLTISGTATLQPLDDLSVGRHLLIAPTAALDGNSVWIGVGGNWTSNGKFTPNGATVSFNGASLTQAIDATTFANVEFVNAGAKSLTGAAVFGGNLLIGLGATLDGGAGLNHSITGDWTNNGTFSPNTSTITFNGGVTQTVGAGPFYNMTVNGAGIVFSGNTTVTNLLHLMAGNANVGTTTLTVASLDLDGSTTIGLSGGIVAVSGNLVTDGSFSGTSGGVLINGTAIQNWTGSNQALENLTINKPSGTLNPSIDLTVINTLTMTQGSIVMAPPATLYVSSGQLAHTAGHVNGRFKMTFNAAAELFPFGTTLGDSFVTLTAAVGDTIDMEIVQGPHPSNTGSNLDLLQTYWTVHAVSSAVNPTLDFSWPVAAVDGVEGDYIIGFWDGSWSHPPGTITSGAASAPGANPIVGEWTVGAPASLGGAVDFSITTDGAADAGVPEAITITAKDTLGNTATAYTGAHTLLFNGASAAPDGTLPTANNDSASPINFGTGTVLTFSAGVATTDLRLYAAEVAPIGVSETGGPSTASTADITVTAGPMAAVEISDVNGAAPLYANAPFTLDVSAIDAYGNATTAPADTNVTLALNCGLCTGTLSGTVNGTILSGAGLVTLSGLQYSAAESGVVIRANTDAYGFADTASLSFATQAPGFVVTSASDLGAGSLREVLGNVNTGMCISPCPVTFNIGTGPQTIVLSSPLPPVEYAVHLDATSQPGFVSNPIIALDGSFAGAAAHGLELTAPGSTIEGFVIRGFAGNGIRIDTDSTLLRTNWIGLALDGITPAPNGTGISILGASNIVGGSLAAERNVISGNTNNGVMITSDAASNTISGNYVGTDFSGMLAVPNGLGVALFSDANSNTIGGPAAGNRNVISGNTGAGIQLKGSTILIDSMKKDASGRKISSNPVILDGTTQVNVITNNFIGVAADGLTALGNAIGVEFNANAKDNDLGLGGAGNVISGNGRAVVLNDATTINNRIRANLIGLGSDGATPVPNTLNGIEITAASGNTIGGSGAGNTIAHNGGTGISVVGGLGNTFLANSIFANGGAGIDLNANGADAQDDVNGDADTGANGTQNYGVISAATITGTNLDVTVSLDSSATTANTLLVEVFEADASGEGQTLLGSTCFVGNVLANQVISMPAGSVLPGDPLVTTATAYADSTCSTVGDGTSEFSTAFLAAACTPPAVTFTTPSAVCEASTGNAASVPATVGATYVWTITNGTIDSGQGTNAITFTAGTTGSVGLSVTATSSTGCVASNSTTVAINPLPDATITAAASACALSSGNVATAPALAGATYAWTITNGTIDSGQGTDSISFTAGSTGSVALSLTVTSAAGCSSNGSTSVAITPAPDATITAPVSACADATGLSASVPAVAGATYAWTISNGTITGGAGTDAITFTAGSSGTTTLGVTVTAGGCSASSSHAVTIAANPSAVILAPTTVCEGSGGHEATIPAQTGATYSWTITNGTIDSGQGTEAITFTAGSAGTTSLSVSVTTGSCTTTGTHNVTVSPKPDATITAVDPICALSTGNIASVTPTAGASYLWTIVNGTITGGNGTDSIVFTAGSTGSVQLGVTVTKDGCSNSSAKSITLKPAPNATITAPTTADPDDSLAASVPLQAGASYVWSITNGTIGSGQGTNAISFSVGNSGTTTLNVMVTLSGCSKSDTHVVTINDPAPREAALSIAKTASASVQPNGTIVYTIAVTNAGPSNATDISVNDPLPAGTTLVSIGAGSWNCASLVTGIYCTGSVNAGSTRGFTITVTAPSTDGSITNTATMTSSIDTTPNDNTASATTIVGSGGECDSNGVPLVIAPAPGASVGSPVTIAWTSVPNAIDYRVHAQVDGAPSLDLGTTGGATELTALLPAGSIVVTVDAIFSGCTDTTSHPVGFTVVIGGACDHRTTAMPLAPATNSTATTAATSFQWAPANDPDGYRLWFAVDGGTPMVLGTTVDETSFDGILPAGAIEWWVEALYDGCASTESPHFFLDIPPADTCSNDLPSPLSPSNGSSTSHGEVMFTWTPVEGALAYELWLSVDHGTPTLMDTTDGTMLKAIVPEGDLEWFVRAVLDRCPARDSAVSRFTYQPPASCVDSLRPIGLAQVTRAHVTSPVDFAWTPVEGSSGYQLFVIRGNGAPELIASTTASHVDDVALSNGKLRWFVRALFSGCTPLDSSEEKLEVVPTPAACSILETPQISAIGQVSSGVPFAIQWSPAPGATRYQLQVATNSAFEGAETVETSAPVHQLTRTNTGADLTPIYARVRAIDDRCATPVTTPFSLVAGIWVLPVDGVEGSAPTTGDDVVHTIQLGSELAGQTFVATAKEPWLTIEPASGVVAEGGTTLVVTADVSTLPVGTTLGSVTVTLGDGSVARTPSANASTFSFSTITVGKVTPIMPTPKSTPPPDALIIPAVAHASGINSQFQSDVRLTNSSARTMQYQLTFTPSGESGIAVGKQTIFSVDPGRTVALDDVLRSWFGTGNESVTGSLEIRPLTQAASSTSSAALTGLANRFTFAASRTFNTTPNGSFGQFIPAVPFANFVGRAAEGAASNVLSLQQIAQSDRYRTNLGLVEGSGEPASLLVKVFGEGGQMLKEFPVQLAGGQHLQLNSFLATNGVGTLDDGRVEVSVLSPGGKVTAYASVLDNATSDPLLVTPVTLSETGNTKWVVPGVADLQNSAANWQTDMRLFNAGTEEVEASLSFYSQTGGTPQVRTVTVPAGQVVQFDRTLASLFGVSNDGGAVHIATATPARLIATARTYNQTSGGTYGQFISAVTPEETAALNTRPLQILQVEESARFRSNIGIAEVQGNAATVEIAVTPPDAKFTAVTQLQLQPNEFRQLTSLLRSMGLADTYNARVSVRVISGTGGVTAYASVIDMATNDPTYVPAQ